MAELEFYDGVDCIGASMVRLTDRGTNVLHDAGANIDRRNKFYSDFMQPREFMAITDRQKLRLLPDLNSIYRPDYLYNEGLEATGRAFDAIFLSHVHVDHSGFLPEIRADLRVLSTFQSYIILTVMQDTAFSYNNDYVRLQLRFALDDKIRREGLVARNNMTVDRLFQFLKPGEHGTVGDIGYTSYPVDHSVPGSVGMVYDTSAGQIAFSGDIRMRGWKRQRTIDFAEKLKGIRPMALVMEGTRIDDSDTTTEEEIVEKASDIAMNLPGLLMVEWSRRNMDRLLTFYEVAKETDRILLIDPMNALLLERLDGYDGYPKLKKKRDKHPHLGLFTWKKGMGLLDKLDREGNSYPAKLVENEYEFWERQFLDYKSRYTLEEVLGDQDKFILYTEYSYLKHWPDFKGLKFGFIPSYPEPYDVRTKDQETIRKEWIKELGVEAFDRLHVHGHMNYNEVKWFINESQPEILLPNHTNHRELFQEMYDPKRIVLAEQGVPLIL